jgi:hypothetical protein
MLSMLLAGSRAMRHHFPDFPRNPKDWDYIVFPSSYPGLFDDDQQVVSDRGIEYLKNPIITSVYSESDDLLTPDHLYTLKMSHVFWPRAQAKHLFDICFLRQKGCSLDRDLFDKLYAHWNVVNGINRRTDFDKPNSEFFDDYVNRKYSHDELHLIMNPHPIYERVKKDLSGAAISEELFRILPLSDQMEMIREEAYVLALERYIIPGLKPWRVAYAESLRTMILRLTPLWLGIFMAENYWELNKPTINFFKKFKEHGEIDIRTD